MTDITAKLAEALRAIAEHQVIAPLTDNDDSVSLDDLPYYVAGKAHAELAILHNIARNALTAYTASQSEPEFGPLDPRIHDLGKWEGRDEGAVEKVARAIYEVGTHGKNYVEFDLLISHGYEYAYDLAMAQARAALSALPRADDALEGIGPRPHVLVCKGCPAYETEAWREPSGDGETYDNGQYAWCNAAGRRSMGSYHYDHNAAPDWCPARARLATQAGER